MNDLFILFYNMINLERVFLVIYSNIPLWLLPGYSWNFPNNIFKRSYSWFATTNLLWISFIWGKFYTIFKWSMAIYNAVWNAYQFVQNVWKPSKCLYKLLATSIHFYMITIENIRFICLTYKLIQIIRFIRKFYVHTNASET